LSVASEKSDRSVKMAKMIDPNKPLTQLELDIVYLRYYEGLHSSEIAEQLGIELEKVKDKMKKPNVARYIHRVVLPDTQKQPKVKLNTANINTTIGAKLFYFAIFIMFVFLAVCIKFFL
jgi:DNA-binding MarR family transcriptional regulator